MKNKLLFLTLNTFSATGGIEKVCRIAGKALYEISNEQDNELLIHSIYDNNSQVNEAYFPSKIFKGFGGSKLKFVASSVQKGRAAQVVILSHINLLLAGYLIKKLSPKTKIILLAHGIEVWEPPGALKSKMLKAIDLFLPVSQFTAGKLTTVLGVSPASISVLNNCLDPFLKKTSEPKKEAGLRKQYGFTNNDFVLFTLTRLKFSEQYKGYDKVVQAMAFLKDSHPTIKYLIAGRYDEEEKARLDKIIAQAGIGDRVVFTGYVDDDSIAAHFNISNAYIMPSTGEGFGIVFIEALFHGLPVIAGNVDGSVDALGGGEFGLLVNPNKIEEIGLAIEQVFNCRRNVISTQHVINKTFGFQTYKTSLLKIISSKHNENEWTLVNNNSKR